MKNTKTFTEARCKTCKLLFQPVSWLAWRVDGFCSEKCAPKPETDEVNDPAAVEPAQEQKSLL